MSKEQIKSIVDQFHLLNPAEASECLHQIATKMVEDAAADLQSMWQDPNAGKVWEIMGKGIDDSITKAMKLWIKS